MYWWFETETIPNEFCDKDTQIGLKLSRFMYSICMNIGLILQRPETNYEASRASAGDLRMEEIDLDGHWPASNQKSGQ